MRNRVRKAFTLVEILIVVVILGILAAIVVPQFTNATQDAQGGNIQTQLDTLQNQMELYKARNNAYPDIVTDWSQLVTGGYLKAAPKNPVNGSSTVTAGAAGAAGFGWHWDAATGTLGACYFDEATSKVTPATP
jgi:general secretion pathway protein G